MGNEIDTLVLYCTDSFTLNQSLNQFKSGFSVLFKGGFCMEKQAKNTFNQKSCHVFLGTRYRDRYYI